MILLSILGMIAGAGILMFMPLSKNRLRRLSSQGLGAFLFAVGLIILCYNLAIPAAA